MKSSTAAEPAARRSWAETTTIAMSLLLMLLGIVVIVGWHGDLPALVQISPGLAPMQYNTALGFVLVGMSLLFSIRDYRRTAAVLGGFIGALALLTLLEYGLDRDFGIDQALFKAPLMDQTSHAGRMSPLTALCFLLSGLNLLLAGLLQRRSFRSFSSALFGSLILALGGMALIGYLTGLVGVYAWGQMTRMAAHTSVGFVLAGIAMLGWVWHGGGRRELASRRWVPIPVGIACLTATFVFWQAMLSYERQTALQATEAMADSTSGLIQATMDSWILAITRMAQRMETAAQLPRREEWESDARNYLEDIPVIHALEWLDSTSVVRWVIPLEGNKELIGTNPNQEPTRQRIMLEAQRTHATQLSPALELIQGGQGVLAFSPVHREDEARGFVVAVLHVDQIVESILTGRGTDDYRIELFEGASRIYTSSVPTPDEQRLPSARSVVTLPGASWTVQVEPISAVLAGWSPFIAIVALAGLIVSLLVPACIAFAQAAARRAREAERSAEQVRENEERFRRAFGDAPIGMALVGTDGRWLRVNHSLCRMLGYSPEELLATNFQTLTHPDDLNADLDQIKKIMAGEIASYDMEKRYLHKSGRLVEASLHVSLIRDRRGQPAYFVSQIVDITQRKEMERMKSEFVSTVSHELRTPLTSIRGSLGLIEAGALGPLPEKVAGMVRIAHQNSERLIHIINDILDIEKIESGKLQLHLTNIRVADFLREALQGNQGYGEKYQVRFELEQAPADKVEVAADPDRLMQVMANLLSNAAKFSNAGESVRIRARAQGQLVRIEVADTGAGIPQEFHASIFEKFVQAESTTARRFEGTGLGLSITRQLVEAMGGKIGFESAVGKGTTFHFELPQVALQPAAAHTDGASGGANRRVLIYGDELTMTGERPALPRILHVEDDVDLSNVIDAALTGKAAVVTATSLQMAQQLLSEQSFSLVVLDIALPDGSGLELLERLDQDSGKAVPVVILSASETTHETRSQVAAALVKSRMSETRVVETLLALIRKASGTPSR